MNQVLRVRLTGRAARYLNLLRHYGHIDDQTEAHILLTTSEMQGAPVEQRVDLLALRRVTASVLFGDDGKPFEGGILNEDWSLLFS